MPNDNQHAQPAQSDQQTAARLEQATYEQCKEGLRTLLTGMQVPLDGIDIQCADGQYIFTAADPLALQRFSIALASFTETQGHALAQQGFMDLLRQEVLDNHLSTLAQKTYMAVLEALKENMQHVVDLSLGEIQIQLPDEVSMFFSALSQLDGKYMRAADGQFIFNFKNYLHDNPDRMLAVENNNEPPSQLLIDQGAIDKPVYTHIESVGNNEVAIHNFYKITPGVIPKFRFILDVSGSMTDHLSKAVANFLIVAQVLFKRYPNAQLHVTTFASHISELAAKPYTRENFNQLEHDLNKLWTQGDTQLHQATVEDLARHNATSYCNTIIFTDGKNAGDAIHTEALTALCDQLEKLDPLAPERVVNKVHVINLGVELDEQMLRIIKLYDSQNLPISHPAFTQTEEGPAVIANSLQLRDLLTITYAIEHANGEVIARHQTNVVSDLAGQYVTSATPIIAPKNSIVNFTVTNPEGDVLVNTVINATPTIACTFNAPDHGQLTIPSSAAILRNPLLEFVTSMMLMARTAPRFMFNQLALHWSHALSDSKTITSANPIGALVPYAPPTTHMTFDVTQTMHTNPNTGVPSFVWHAYAGKTQVGQIELVGHPILCRYADGALNIGHVSGIFTKMQVEPNDIKDTCAPLPTAANSNTLSTIGAGVQGLVKGASHVLQESMQQHGYSDNVSLTTAVTLRYLAYGLLFLTLHAFQEQTEEADTSVTMRVLYNLLWVAAFELLAPTLTKIAALATENGYSHTGSAIHGVGKVTPALSFISGITQGGFVRSLVSMGVGTGADYLTQMVGSRFVLMPPVATSPKVQESIAPISASSCSNG